MGIKKPIRTRYLCVYGVILYNEVILLLKNTFKYFKTIPLGGFRYALHVVMNESIIVYFLEQSILKTDQRAKPWTLIAVVKMFYGVVSVKTLVPLCTVMFVT